MLVSPEMYNVKTMELAEKAIAYAHPVMKGIVANSKSIKNLTPTTHVSVLDSLQVEALTTMMIP
jgi:hypothetical protein